MTCMIINYLESKWSAPRLSILRTLWVNFRCLSLCRAFLLPIRIYGKVKLACLDGNIELPDGTKLEIGRNVAAYVNTCPGRLSILSGGTLRVGKGVKISQGVNILVHNDSLLEFGDYCTVGDNAKIICYNHISIGNHTDLTWETQTMDFNSHPIEQIGGGILQIISEIYIGNYCWIGNRSSVMPGTVLPDRIIVASNSLLNRDYSEIFQHNSLVGGIPSKLLKDGVRRIYEKDKEYKIINEQLVQTRAKRHKKS